MARQYSTGGPFASTAAMACEMLNSFLTELYAAPYDIVAQRHGAKTHNFTEPHGDLPVTRNTGARARFRRKACRRSLSGHESKRRRTVESARRHRYDGLLRDCEWNFGHTRQGHRGASDCGVKERGGTSSPYGGPSAGPLGAPRFRGFRRPRLSPDTAFILPDRAAVERCRRGGNRLKGRIRQ